MRQLEEMLGSRLITAWTSRARNPYAGEHRCRASCGSQLIATAVGHSRHVVT